MSSATDDTTPRPHAEPMNPASSQWTYPTRTCRLCLEDVPATVSLYPPGLPPAFQRVHVEYKNDDEYGRLIRPCKCQGSMRYIHELCLRRSRTESVRPGSLWKCHQCGHQFSFRRLTLQKYLGSTAVSGILTILVMVVFVFILGFIADPIINLYIDPYDTLVGNEDYWQGVEIEHWTSELSGWAQHFAKGLVSMGVLSFLRTALLNPFHLWGLRQAGFNGGRAAGRSMTGRERVVNIRWVMIAVGVLSAFYVFYQWVQLIIGRSLQRIGNNIVDTQLSGDDEDLKPPPDFKVEESYPEIIDHPQAEAPDQESKPGDGETGRATSTGLMVEQNSENNADGVEDADSGLRARAVPGEWVSVEPSSCNSTIENTHRQGWSFNGL